MTLDDLIAEYREEAHDSGTPPFVSDAWLTKRANQAEQEVCRRSGLLIESVHAMCTVAVTAGDPVVSLNSKIIDIKKARMSLDAVFLLPASVNNLCATWEADTGTPSHYITDYQSGAIRLYPVPVVDDDLKLTVTRLPLVGMSAGTDEPEIRAEYHDALVQWLLHRAYAKQDIDIFDPHKSARALAEFEREFGTRSSARNEHWMRARHVLDAAPIA
jgi:hypothetical protein